MNRDDGGHAFPAMVEREVPKDTGNYQMVREPEGGMSLRDYFAAKAMGDVFGHFNWTTDSIEKAAACSYQIADAMLKERLK